MSNCPLEGELVEQSEAHVVIFLGLWLRLLGSGSRGRSSLASGSSSSSGSRGTSGRNGAELLCPLLDQLRDVLAGELGDHFVHLLVIGVDTNGAENTNGYGLALTRNWTNLRIFLMLSAETSCPPWAASKAAAT